MQNRKTIMKTTKFTCLSLFILTLLVRAREPYRTDINPALVYYRAFLLAPEPMSEADRDYSVRRNKGRNKSSRNGSAKSLPAMTINSIWCARRRTPPCLVIGALI